MKTKHVPLFCLGLLYGLSLVVLVTPVKVVFRALMASSLPFLFVFSDPLKLLGIESPRVLTDGSPDEMSDYYDKLSDYQVKKTWLMVSKVVAVISFTAAVIGLIGYLIFPAFVVLLFLGAAGLGGILGLSTACVFLSAMDDIYQGVRSLMQIGWHCGMGFLNCDLKTAFSSPFLYLIGRLSLEKYYESVSIPPAQQAQLAIGQRREYIEKVTSLPTDITNLILGLQGAENENDFRLPSQTREEQIADNIQRKALPDVIVDRPAAFKKALAANSLFSSQPQQGVVLADQPEERESLSNS